MPVTDDRILPLASIRLHTAGCGVPLMTDWGHDWYDVLRQSWGFGSIAYDATHPRWGAPLRYIEGIGLTCNELATWQDTHLANWTTSGGSWEERLPAYGGEGRVYRLCQYDSTADQEWNATSDFLAPANPHFAFTLQVSDVPPDQDTETYPPYVQVEIGGFLAIAWDYGQGWSIRRFLDDDLLDVVSLPEVEAGPAGGLPGEALVLVRCQRGKVWVSCDSGQTWNGYGNADGTALNIPAHKVKVAGQGVVIAFGLHQLLYNTGTYTSAQHATFTDRLGGGTPTLEAVANTPLTSTATVAESSPSGTSSTIGYALTLTPCAAAASPWTWYTCPDVQAVLMTLARASSNSSGYTTPWDGDLLTIDVDEPFELGEGSMSWEVEKDWATQFTGNYRDRMVDCFVGHLHEDASTDSTQMFRGFIVSPQGNVPEYGEGSLRFQARAVPYKLKGQKINSVQGSRPLGGLTENAVLDWLLGYAGLDTTWRSWHSEGDLITLAAGDPEDPAYWPQVGDDVWEWMERIARWCGHEVGVTRAGVLTTVPLDYLSATTYLFYADPASDGTTAVRRISFGLKCEEARTLVEARGYGANGELLVAVLGDAYAEGTPANARFSGMRRPEIEIAQGVCTIEMIQRMCQGMAAQWLQLPAEGDIEVPVNLQVGRRDTVQVIGTKAGLADTELCVVRSLTHHIVNDPTGAEVSSRASVQRL